MSPWARAGVVGFISLTALACQPQISGSRAERYAKLPDWSGIWVSAEPIGTIDIDGYADFNPLTDWQVFGIMAPYNEATRAAANERLIQSLGSFKATSWGFPLMMEAPTPLQFLITPDETLILNFYRDARHVYTDGRTLPAQEDRWPTPWGESVGRWEGDTLVIETVSVAGLAGIPLPFLVSEEAVYVERIRMTDADHLESEMTVTDPSTLTEPWVLRLSYKRAPNFDRMFHMPFDNDRTTLAADGLYTIAPQVQ